MRLNVVCVVSLGKKILYIYDMISLSTLLHAILFLYG